jgi:glucose-1-phosphate thymidylyltransferase
VQAVVLAAGEGTRLRPLTEDKPKGMVGVAGKPILTHCFEQLVDLGAEKLVVVVSQKKQNIISHYGDEFEHVPITYAHQREQNGLAHALLKPKEHVDEEFMLMLGDNIFQANLEDVVNRQQEDRADAAFLAEEVPYEEANRYGVCDTNDYDEIQEVVEKPDDLPLNLVITGF